MKFQELDLKQELQNAVVKAGYTEATPIQEKTMPVILEGRDLIACAQTGTGKTAAFALPILEKLDNGEVRKLRSLVLTPTRELAVQIFENFKKYGRYLPLRAACIYGGAKQKPQMEALRRGCDILVATPGRLMDYMNLGLVSLKGIEIFVLDEADRMLDMGFINDVRKIAGSMNTDRQTLMFSATMPKEIEQLGRELLRNPADVRVAPQSTAADTVDQKICFVGHSDKLKVLAEILKQEEVTRTIIFTRTKHGADRVARNLTRSGIAAKAIHGDKTQGQRQSTLEGYKAGHFHVLVATDVASRGLDIPEVSHVINFNLPQEPEQKGPRLVEVKRAVPMNMIVRAYRMCGRGDVDYHACDMLSDVLANGKSSRFYANVLSQTQLFTELDAAVAGSNDPGLFYVRGRLADGVSWQQAEDAIDGQLRLLLEHGVSRDEMEKCANKAESTMLFENVSYSTVASKLCQFHLLTGQASDINTEAERYRRLRPDDLMRVAKKLFDPNHCSTVHYGAQGSAD